jgi:glutathionylspermidine synthase
MPWGASDVQGNGEALRQAAPCDGREGNYAVLGSWIVQGKPCGLSVREDLEPITKNASRFLPHAIIG